MNEISMSDKQNTFVFEVSWEVCNKVGGIYTVIRSKMKEAVKNFGQNYVLIGPLLPNNRHFVQTAESICDPFLCAVIETLKKYGINCKVGNWDTPGMPKVILVNYEGRYKIDEVLYRLWSGFGVDSLASNFDYIEPLLFATVAGEVIRYIAQELLGANTRVIAHFHEWLCGAGLLYLKQYTNIATVFTTHATVLGRVLAQSHRDIYNLPTNFDPKAEARIYGVYAKHSLEYASAKEADCFATVSSVTAEEAYLMLNKYPDKITQNGLDIERIQAQNLPETQYETRKKLLEVARTITKSDIPDDAKMWLTSGRYEFHNKGFDLFLQSIATLKKKLPDNAPHIVIFVLVAANHRTAQDSLLDNTTLTAQQKLAFGLATHKIDNPYSDPIIKSCIELNLIQNGGKVHVVYSDAYLNGNDGVFDLHYESILSACDLGVFPSFYEPWGYTPFESVAYGVPTITTDLAGFGCWVETLKVDYRDAIYVLEYKHKSMEVATDNLCDILGVIAYQDTNKLPAIKEKVKSIAKLADWTIFYNDYLDAYAQALEFNAIYYAKFGTEEDEAYVTSIHEEASTLPRFRTFQHESYLPETLGKLRELAYNLWWSWNNHHVSALFSDIDPKLWERTKCNPIDFINKVSSSALSRKAHDAVYMKKYHNIIAAFQAYQEKKTEIISYDSNIINKQHPIAYFCLEYGLDECLPIYSGGLGILAGDYLKSISDLDIPLIAIGLFYKQGYFSQKINLQGEQIAEYPSENPNQLPMRKVSDDLGEPLYINIEVLNRTLHIAVWEVQVGKVTLYLLDTDVAKNSAEDRQITNRLYGGSREHRLLQEIVLGIGGTRFIIEQLKISPSVYHLNEGHSAFLLLERLKDLYNQGLSIFEAYEAVRGSSVFTTHTSVPAGNEVFPDEMIVKYFARPAKLLGLPLDKLLEVGKNPEGGVAKSFSLTALVLRSALGINAVSDIHKTVVRSMWKNIWPGFLKDEVPVMGITNGVHLPTWIGDRILMLYNKHLGDDWMQRQHDPKMWDGIKAIPNKILWKVHQCQKERLLEAVKNEILREYAFRNESDKLINASLDCLNPDTMVIGLSRRFATYKRHNLILRNPERLADILTDKDKPVILLIAGKAHPADILGQKIINTVVTSLRQNMFKGHIIFLENYDMNLAKLLVQGVDVWLNNPIINTEACGTSGMKVGMNGGLNFSIKDGWWAEAYAANPNVGWAIESFESDDDDRRDEMENIFMLDTLEHQIVNLYYEERSDDSKWVAKMKDAMALVSYQFNTQRMVKDYCEQLYNPLAKYNHNLNENSHENLKILIEWKQNLVARFGTVKIKTVLVNGIKDGRIRTDGVVKIKVLLFSGKMKASELKPQLVLAKSDGTKFVSPPLAIPLVLEDKRESGVLTYSLEYKVEDTGFYAYGIRVLPWHRLLYDQSDVGIALWG
jgi:phosphorylase/glycogen(starch) synthase